MRDRINITGKLAAFAASSLLLFCGMTPVAAFADPEDDDLTSSELEAKADDVRVLIADTQVELDQASDAYYKALGERDKAEKEAADARDRIAKSNKRIDELRGDLGDRAVDMYKNGSASSTVNMLFGASTIEELLSTIHYLSCVASKDAAMIDESETLKEDVMVDRLYADEQAMTAKAKAGEADKIQKEVSVKVDNLQERLDELDEKARVKAQEEAAALAAQRAAEEAAAAAAAAAQNNSSSSSSSKKSKSSEEESAPAPTTPANGSVVEYAQSRLGCPYVWGASGPSSFDCSGLVMWCYAQCGISLPHNTEAQYSCASAVIPVSAAQPGDVLYMPGHVGICISSGGGTYIHAPTSGDVVRVASWPMFSCALRF